ncbi:MAG: cyclic nucleotide-binding domain-containing protein [Verrucomicrobiae bacterium]|nr:cyclic nucleotide-binding domain-containing protein [Verrucomicrobiae bacterium]
MATFLDQFFHATQDEGEIFSLLRATPVFHPLNLKELRRIESIVHSRTYQPEEIIFEQGEEGLGFYVVRSGQIRISRLHEGRQKEVAVVTRGGFFGELALLDGAPRSAQAQAVEKTELIGFFRPDLIQLFETNPAIAAKVSFELAKWIGRRLRETLMHPVRSEAAHVL